MLDKALKLRFKVSKVLGKAFFSRRVTRCLYFKKEGNLLFSGKMLAQVLGPSPTNLGGANLSIADSLQKWRVIS